MIDLDSLQTILSGNRQKPFNFVTDSDWNLQEFSFAELMWDRALGFENREHFDKVQWRWGFSDDRVKTDWLWIIIWVQEHISIFNGHPRIYATRDIELHHTLEWGGIWVGTVWLSDEELPEPMGSRHMVIRLRVAIDRSWRPIMDEPTSVGAKPRGKVIFTKVGFIRSKGTPIPINNQQATRSSESIVISARKVELLQNSDIDGNETRDNRNVVDRLQQAYIS